MVTEFKHNTLDGVNKAINDWITKQDNSGNRLVIHGIETKTTDTGYSTAINYESVNKTDFIDFGLSDDILDFGDSDFKI